MIKMQDVSLNGKRVLIREDFNVPLKNGVITSDARIRAALPTIQSALEAGAAILLMSHLGRPTEGQFDAESSLKPVADHLETLLQQPVKLVKDWLNGVDVKPGDIVLCENVRFNVGEKSDDETLARQMAALCDVFVMDAFGTAHRAQASTHGVAKFAPIACAGPLLVAELDALGKALKEPKGPVVAVVGGSKVSTKLTVLEALADKVDHLIVGGGIANTFLAANGVNVGKSLYEPDLINQAKALMSKMKAKGGSVPMPTDVAVATEFSDKAVCIFKDLSETSDEDMIFDVGPDTADTYLDLMQNAGTIIWNGPVGVFEFPNFANGTKKLGEAIATSKAFSIAGGGDTLAAIDQFKLTNNISYISTGGGAFLEFVEGKVLPAVAILEERGLK